MNIAPRTIKMCALFKPIFSFRLSISGYVILKTFRHDMSCAELCNHIWVNGTRVPDHYCGEANPMLLPVCTLNFFLGNTSMLFWKIYLDESLWCSFPFLLICCCFLSCWVAMLEELGQNGNYIYCCKLLVIQSSSTLQSLLDQTYHVAAFSSCKVSVYLVRKHQPPQHTLHSLSNSQQWHSHTRKSVPMVLASCRDIHVLCVAVYCFSKLNVFWVQFSKLVFANYG